MAAGTGAVFDPPGHIRLPITDDEIIDRALSFRPLTGRLLRLVTSSAVSCGRDSEVALPREQRRGRSIAMGKAELDAFLTRQRTCRVATADQDGLHLTALWYVWDGTGLWLYSVVRSQRWTDISRDGRVAVQSW
jgi:Pyridoxamine 5'-phosphate oxidase